MSASIRSSTISLFESSLFIAFLQSVLELFVNVLSRLRKSSAKDLPLPTNRGIFTGDLTYYSPGPGYGACGFENTSEDSICAVSHIIVSHLHICDANMSPEPAGRCCDRADTLSSSFTKQLLTSLSHSGTPHPPARTQTTTLCAGRKSELLDMTRASTGIAA